MKIQNSSISMSSSHSYSSFSQMESVTIEGRALEDLKGVILNLSKEAEDGSYTEAIKMHQKQQEEAAKKQQEAVMKRMLQPLKTNHANGYMGTSDEYDLKLELLRQMLQMLNKGKYLDKLPGKKLNSNGVLDLRSHAQKVSAQSNTNFLSGVSGGNTVNVNAGTIWTKVTATSGSFSEYESTTFASKGLVQTADGRNIEFDVSFGMSRACEMEFNSLEVSQYVVTDPLIINLDTDMPSVSEQKFFFDLDSDGKGDEISFVGKGSGFLALDKNGDGVINDGNELFGTKSGDGFKDLSDYNDDGNLWIDENDSVFRKLKIWMKDEEGNDMLLSLKDADVGAIYLGNAGTEHTLRGEDKQVNGILRKTGVYLKESTGKIGTVNHIDLAM